MGNFRLLRIPLFVLLTASNLYAQTITPEQRQQIIRNLNDVNPFVRSAAVDDAARFGIKEAIPIIEQKIWNEGPGPMTLRALDLLEDPNLYTIARTLIDSAQTMASRWPYARDALETRVTATEYLYKFNDFSSTQYIFDYLRDTTRVERAGVFQILKSVIRNVPAYADSARKELLRIARSARLPIDRSIALDDLVELYGTEMFSELVNMAVNDQDPGGSNRLSALHRLYELDYPELHSLLQDRLSKEVGWPYRCEIADSLLVRYGTPSDYQFVLAYQATAPNPTEKSLIGKALQAFTPPIPSPSSSILNLLDSLISYKHQTSTFGWLADKNFVKELDNHLDNARKHLTRGDSANTSKEVEQFQEKVNKEYLRTVDREGRNQPRDNRFVTVEGWKFLYFNAQYILDRLPKKKTR